MRLQFPYLWPPKPVNPSGSMRKISLLIFLLLTFCLTCPELSAQFTESLPCCVKRQHNFQNAYRTPPPLLHNDINGYDVKFYFLDLEMSNTSIYLKGSVRIDAKVVVPVLDTFVVELIPALTIDSIKINGQLKPFVRLGDEVYVPGLSFVNDAALSVTIWYKGTPSIPGGFFSGISNGTSPSWGAQVTWTLSEPFNAKQWWPVKQVLSDKADSVWVFITTASANKAGSNGLLTAVTNMGNGKVRYEWKSRYPINYYLISAAVSTYVDYSTYAHPAGYSDSILIQNYVYSNPQTLTYFKSVIDQTASLIELYSDKFGLYPFAEEKYGHSMAPLGGGMEHQTMTTLGSFSFGLVAHELAHQWFGDYVTCATWQDIWINEGFASYAEYISAQYLQSYAAAQALMADVHSNVKSQPGGSVFVPASQAMDENRIFSGRLSYDKGSAIIHMLRFEIGNDQVFYNVLKTFLSTYADGVASGDDFRQVAETVSGKNLQHFFDQWYYGEGYPLYQVEWAQIDPQTVRIITRQTTSTTVTPLFTMPLECTFSSVTSGDTTIRIYVTQTTDTFFVPLNRTVTGLAVDPEKWMLMDVTSIKNTTGMEEVPTLSAAVFPNPAKDLLYLRLDDKAGIGNFNFLMMDVNGRVVKKYNLFGNSHTISVSDLPSGIFFWQIISDSGLSSGRILIK